MLEMRQKRWAIGLLVLGLAIPACTDLLLPDLVQQADRTKRPKQRVRLPAPDVEAPPGSTVFKIDISGSQFDPPVETLGTGAASIAISPDQHEVAGAILIGDLSSNPIGAHIHRGYEGENGNAVKTLNVVGQMAHFKWRKDDTSERLTDELLSELLAGNLYLDIHTVDFPNGEIRGQLVTK